MDPLTAERLLAEAREDYEAEQDARDKEDREKEEAATEWREKPCPISR